MYISLGALAAQHRCKDKALSIKIQCFQAMTVKSPFPLTCMGRHIITGRTHTRTALSKGCSRPGGVTVWEDLGSMRM